MTSGLGGDRLRHVLGVAILALAGWADAEAVPDLYSASVPVAEQSPGELQRAAATALREVAVRVSGRSGAASEPALAPAFVNAMRYLEQYRYERNPGGDSPWLAQLRFAAATVDAELRNRGLPVWGGNRPALLTVVAVDEQGARAVIDELSPVADALRAQWRRRGLVLHLPSNAGGLNVDDAMRLDSAKIGADLPDRGDGLLLGSITVAGGSCTSRWSLHLGAQTYEAEATGAAVPDCVGSALDRIVDNFSAQYAIGADSAAEGIVLRVTGVVSFDDYSAVLNYLRRLAVIKSAQPIIVRGDEVLFQLNAAGSAAQLARQLALESRLSPAENSGDTPMPVALSYRWAPVRH